MQNGSFPHSVDSLVLVDDLNSHSPCLVLAAHQHGQRKLGVEKAPSLLLSICDARGDLIHHPVAPSFSVTDGGISSILDAALQDARNTENSTSTFLKKKDGMEYGEKWGDAPVLNAPMVASNNKLLHEAIFSSGLDFLFNQATLVGPATGSFPRILTIGGDHSIAMGSVSAISLLVREALEMQHSSTSLQLPFSSPELVVIWIDAHADINTPGYTHSGNLHGCPVSLLSGWRKDDWLAMPEFSWITDKMVPITDVPKTEDPVQAETDNNGAFIKLSKLAYIGIRDVDDDEEDTIASQNILNWRMPAIKSINRDMSIVVKDILAALDPEGIRPIHISFDIDGIDPRWTPSTGTPVPDGLFPQEGVDLVRLFKATGRVVSMDLVEVNPSIGANQEEVQSTLDTAVALIAAFAH